MTENTLTPTELTSAGDLYDKASISGVWFRSAVHRIEAVTAERDALVAILSKLPADALAKVKADAVREARDAIMPPYNFEMRQDGSEDPGAAEYASLMNEVHRMLGEEADRIERGTQR